MSRHRFEIELVVDDELLADHDGDEAPPPNDVEEWEFRDILRAAERELVDESESVAAYYGSTPDPEPA